MPNPTTRQEIMKMTHPMGPLRNRKVYADFIQLNKKCKFGNKCKIYMKNQQMKTR